MLSNLVIAIHCFQYEKNELNLKSPHPPENGSQRKLLLPDLDRGQGIGCGGVENFWEISPTAPTTRVHRPKVPPQPLRLRLMRWTK